MNNPNCPKCNSQHVYADGNLWTCPECGHEWSLLASDSTSAETETAIDEDVVKDAFGTILTDGDSVILTKELRVKGSSTVLKVGTKVRNIRLQDADDGHNISCKVDGVGSLNLKSEFVKKV